MADINTINLSVNNDVKKAVELFGKDIISQIVVLLKDKDKEASGKLINSFNSTVSSAVNQILLSIDAENYFKHVNDGREANKTPPPIDKIKEWTSLKNIPEKAAYPIALSISKYGIPSTDIIEQIIKDNQLKLEMKVEESFYSLVSKQIDSLIK